MSRIAHVEPDEAAVPVREEHQLAVLRRLGAVAVVRVGVAALSARERSARVLNPPVRDLRGCGRIRDVDHAEVAIAVDVAEATRRACLRIAARRHGRVGKGAAEVTAMLDLELVHSARAAGGPQIADLLGLSGNGDVPEHQPALGVRIEA
jgi:hypothetical protein